MEEWDGLGTLKGSWTRIGKAWYKVCSDDASAGNQFKPCSLSSTAAISADAAPVALLWLQVFQLAKKCS